MKTKCFICFLIFWAGVTAPAAFGQMTLGQYEDEAPAGSWNAAGYNGADALSLGGLSFAFARDVTGITANPALINRLPGFTLAVNGFFTNASMQKFAVVNTGVLATQESPGVSVYGLDFGGVTYQVDQWGFALAAGILEIYDRPAVTSEYESGGEVLRRVSFKQNGFLRSFSLSVCRWLGSRITAGIGINVVSGSLERESLDYYSFYDDLTISDLRSQSFSGFFLNGGITAELHPGVILAAVFRSPYRKNAEGESLSRYHIPAQGTDIQISGNQDSRYHQPFMAGAGLSFQVTREFRGTADLAFFNWRRYKVNYFGVDLPRDFRNTLPFSLGAEYLGALNVLGVELKIPVWAGFHYDPQPMTDPASFYSSFSFGIGIRSRHIFLHVGSKFSTEQGSGDDLAVRAAALTIGYKSE